MDTRDFRVRAFLYIENEGVARGLHNHIMGVYDDAVDINSSSPNAEMRNLELNDAWTVIYDLCFPPDKQDIADGLFNHTKNIPAVPLPVPAIPEGSPVQYETGFVSIERCGHRIKQGCEITDSYKVI